jgi:hypothetical protein
MSIKLKKIKNNDKIYKGIFNNMKFVGYLTSDNTPKGKCSFYDQSDNLIFSAVMSDTTNKVTNIEVVKESVKAECKYGKYNLIYSGDVNQNKPHGVGVLTHNKTHKPRGHFPDVLYNGNFVNGFFEGKGTYSDDWRTYKGCFKKGLANGKGEIDYHYRGRRTLPGAIMHFSGNFKNNKRNGNGHATYSDDWHYKGDFHDDQFHGKGEMKIICNDKTFIFNGLFVKNEIKGLGVLKNDEMEIFGIWDVYKISKGTITYKKMNIKYEGFINSDNCSFSSSQDVNKLDYKRNGKGVLTYNHEEKCVCTMDGEFKDDKFISGKLILRFNDYSNKDKKFEYEVEYSGSYDDNYCLHGNNCSIFINPYIIKNNNEEKIYSYSGNFNHGKIISGESISVIGKFIGQFNEFYPILKKFNIEWCKKIQDYQNIKNNNIDVFKYGSFCNNKIKYIGSYKNNGYDGEGSFINLEDNSYYSGGFKNSKKHGFGRYRIVNFVYRGSFKDDNYCGHGEESIKNEIYVGNFENNKRNGKGILKFKDNGDIYEGNFINGEISGKGLYKFANGDYYKGEFLNSFRSNYGIYFYKAENLKVSGNWKDNKEEGKMNFDYGNKKVEFKHFKNGVEVGIQRVKISNSKKRSNNSNSSGKNSKKFLKSISAGKVAAVNTLLSMNNSK